MTLGAGGLRNVGGQYLIVASARQNNLSADVYESDAGDPTFTAIDSGWSINVPNSDSPRALFITPSRNVDIKVSTLKHDGAAIYFRVEDDDRMWRLAFGDVDPQFYYLPYWNWRWGWWWGDYFGYYRTRWGRRWLYWWGGYIPASPGYCVKSPPYISYDQANRCVCTQSNEGYTIYKSNQEPDYDFEHHFSYDVDCGGSYCSRRRRKNCNRGCIQSTKITPYYCVGGTPATYIARYEENVSVPRMFVQYRDGTMTWQTLYQQEPKGNGVREREGNDVRIVAQGTKIDVYYGSYDLDKWTFDATFQDTVTTEAAVKHGIGGADVSEDFTSVAGGLRSLWIQSQ